MKTKISRATFQANGVEDEKAADIEDSDDRFLHGLKKEGGPNMHRKFFKNVEPEYLMLKCQQMERYDVSMFMRFIHMGKAMIDYAEAGDLENFKRLFLESQDKEIM